MTTEDYTHGDGDDLRNALTGCGTPGTLTAAGGWCAPLDQTYELIPDLPEEPMPEHKPGIGDTVHYMARGSADGKFAPEPRAALVTDNRDFVYDGTLSLYVVSPNGTFHDSKISYSADGEPGTWDYRPTDKGQPEPQTPDESEVTFERRIRLRILRDMHLMVEGFMGPYPTYDPLGSLLRIIDKEIATLNEAGRE